MSISISYSTTYATNTVAEYLSDWSAYFGDLNHREGSVKEGSNTGGFNPGPFDGTQYGVSSTESNAAVVANGDLHYTLFNPPSHTLWGSIDSLNLGTIPLKQKSQWESALPFAVLHTAVAKPSNSSATAVPNSAQRRFACQRGGAARSTP